MVALNYFLLYNQSEAFNALILIKYVKGNVIMKNLKKIFAMLIAVLIIAMSSLTSLAADINGASANTGDTVTYTLNLADVPSPVAGVQLSVFYDSAYLEPDPSSITCNGLPGYLVNTNNTGEISMNASNGVEGYDFTSKNELISISFNVLKDGNTKITYFIYELYDIYEYGPGDYLKTYTLTSDIAVNGSSVTVDATPIVDPDRFEAGNTVGDFVNNEEGVGEVSPEDATPPPSQDLETVENNSDNNSGEDDLDEIDSTGVTDESNNSNNNITAIIIGVVAAIVVIAAAVIIVLRRKKSAGSSKQDKQ